MSDPMAFSKPARRRQAIKFNDASRTKQSDKTQADINSIVAKYNRTGVTPGMRTIPQYGDFSAVQTLHEALNLVRDATTAFASLPAHIRDACGNNPVELLELVADPDRRQEAEELGLVEPDEILPAPVAAPQPGEETPEKPSEEGK